MVICYVVNRHRCVSTVMFPSARHILRWTDHVIAKPAVYITFTAHCVRIVVASEISWLS